jgi:hypothetical protein
LGSNIYFPNVVHMFWNEVEGNMINLITVEDSERFLKIALLIFKNIYSFINYNNI